MLLDVRIIQVAHTSDRNTGCAASADFPAFNVYAEEQSILNANQSLVQQIISSGLASPNDPLAILGILHRLGPGFQSLFSSGFALFGGGFTQSALVSGLASTQPEPELLRFARLDQIQLRVGGRRAGNGASGRAIPDPDLVLFEPVAEPAKHSGTDRGGHSSSFRSLLSSLTGTVPNVPMVHIRIWA